MVRHVIKSTLCSLRNRSITFSTHTPVSYFGVTYFPLFFCDITIRPNSNWCTFVQDLVLRWLSVTIFATNLMPKMWRKLKVTSITRKVSGYTNVKFRPITIISPFLKSVETLLLLSLQLALVKPIGLCQFSYKCKRSTLDTVVVLSHNIMFSLERGNKYVRCSFLDYTPCL